MVNTLIEVLVGEFCVLSLLLYGNGVGAVKFLLRSKS